MKKNGLYIKRERNGRYHIFLLNSNNYRSDELTPSIGWSENTFGDMFNGNFLLDKGEHQIITVNAIENGVEFSTEEREYPHLATPVKNTSLDIDYNSNYIILFKSKGIGTVIKATSKAVHQEGYFSNHWSSERHWRILSSSEVFKENINEWKCS